MLIIKDTKEVRDYLNLFKAHDKIKILCANCNKECFKDKGKINAALKNKKYLYCSLQCFGESRKTSVEVVCVNCSKKFYRRKSEIVGNIFCGSSCSAIYNNSERIRTKKVKVLRNQCSCGGVKYRKSINCNSCTLTNRKKLAEEQVKAKTLKEIKLSYNGNTDRAYGRVNAWARRYNELEHRLCKLCGYKKYVEICHLKSISKFSDDSTVGVINSKDNLVYLCPNHHKELDLGLLKPKQINRLK